jgi:hypothetical protein
MKRSIQNDIRLKRGEEVSMKNVPGNGIQQKLWLLLLALCVCVSARSLERERSVQYIRAASG